MKKTSPLRATVAGLEVAEGIVASSSTTSKPAAAIASMLPSPPSAKGIIRTLVLHVSPSLIASATCLAERVPLNLSGAIRTEEVTTILSVTASWHRREVLGILGSHRRAPYAQTSLARRSIAHCLMSQHSKLQ